MNADEAREQAIHALATRLRAWKVDNPEIRARDYVAGLYSAGWRWQPTENRPTPPRRDDECPTHAGQWADRCAGCAADRLARPEHHGRRSPGSPALDPDQLAAKHAAFRAAIRTTTEETP